MKVILVNPSNVTQKSNIFYRKLYPGFVPLGPLYLASYLTNAGHNVYLHDMVTPGASEELLFEKIKKEQIDIVGFSVLTASSKYSNILSNKIKEINSRIIIVWGNTHATYFAKEILKIKNTPVDFIIKGEAELVFITLCHAISNNLKLKTVKGICYNDSNNNFVDTGNGPFIEDLNTLLYPKHDLVDLDFYADFPLFYVQNERYTMIQASRGCAYRCYFCAQDVIINQTRFRTAKNVVTEIQYLINKFNTSFFAFADAYFPYSIKFGLEFCDEIEKRGLGNKIKWITETRVDKVNSELLKRMKSIGCKSIMYGIETFSQENMDKIEKKTTNQQAIRAIKETKEAGIMVGGLFVYGMPNETEQDCLETLKFSKDLKLDLAKFHTLIPYPGTKFYDEYYKHKKINNPEAFDAWNAAMTNNSEDKSSCSNILSSKKLASLQRRSMLSFYLRPSVIKNLVIGGYFSPRQVFWMSLMVVFMIINEIKMFFFKIKGFK